VDGEETQWSHRFDLNWLRNTSIEESKRQHVTAGLTSAAGDPGQLNATLERLARELAAISYVSNSVFASVTEQRAAVLRRLYECFEEQLKVINSGAKGGTARSSASTHAPIVGAGVTAGVSVMLALLQDALVRNPTLAAVLLSQLLQQVAKMPALHIGVGAVTGEKGAPTATEALCMSAFDQVGSLLATSVGTVTVPALQYQVGCGVCGGSPIARSAHAEHRRADGRTAGSVGSVAWHSQ